MRPRIVPRGLEASAEAAVSRRLRLSGSYTFLDAEVTEAFSASASFNPAFPGIVIGAFSPLVGERPFRRPRHSGTLTVMYVQDPTQVMLSGYFAGRRDDSTFLSDEFFGNSMLLPNRDLAAAYQKIDLSGLATVVTPQRVLCLVDDARLRLGAGGAASEALEGEVEEESTGHCSDTIRAPSRRGAQETPAWYTAGVQIGALVTSW